MERNAPKSARIRGLEKFDAESKSGAKPEAAAIRGIEKFGLEEESKKTGDEDPRLQTLDKEVAGVMKDSAGVDPSRSAASQPPFMAGTHDSPQRAPTTLPTAPEKDAGAREQEALDVSELRAIDRVEIDTPEGRYVLEYFHRGHFEVTGPDGKFAGDGHMQRLQVGSPVELVLTGRKVVTGPILSLGSEPQPEVITPEP